MLRNSIGLKEERSGFSAPSEGVSISTDGLECKGDEHESIGSFSSEIEGMGDNAT